MTRLNFQTEWRQGPLPQGFDIDLSGEYITLVGANNAAKSTILQALFRRFYNQFNFKDKHGVCLILPERMYVHTSTETGGRTFEAYNTELLGSLSNAEQNRSYVSPQNPVSSELPKLLLTHWDFLKQLAKLNEYLRYFNLPEYILSGPQEIRFEEISVAIQGSGLRSIFAILAALTDKYTQLLLIDEPEQSLEAGVQKRLRDLFYDLSSQEGKTIVVTTHSHLFLNRKDFASNYTVSKENGQVSIHRLDSQAELYDVTFSMLGSSVEDLFFPYNYMVVEGGTDQIIANKVMALKGIGSDRVKVLSATGITNVANMLSAVQKTLIPLIVNDSPYASRVVALVDKPNRSPDATYERLQRDLGDRLFTLTETSLEEYLPDYLYIKCGRDKAADRAELERLKGDYEQLRALKTQIAEAIAGVLVKDDLATIPVFAEAVDKANG